MRTVAFLGIGAMGFPMAGHIAAAGNHVQVFDPFAAQLTRAAEAGLAPRESPAEAVDGADVVVTMVATPEQLLSLFTSPDGIAKELQSGQTVIVMSTVGVEAVHQVQQLLPDAVSLLDAPVTGGAAGAEAGTLTLLVGGPADLVEQCRPVLESTGRIALCGPSVGDGQAVKLVNQLLCSVHLAAAGEALAFAQALGLDPGAVLDIVTTGAANSWMLSDRGPRMLQSDPPVRSTIDIFVKDSSLVSTAAADVGFDASLLNAAAARFRDASASGWGRNDDSTVVRTYAGPDAQSDAESDAGADAGSPKA